MLKLILLNALYLLLCFCLINCDSENFHNEETPVCGGFIEFDTSFPIDVKKQIDYSSINVQLFTMDMILKDHTNLAASGYYFLPIYDNESFILKISGPNGMNFEPEQYVFQVDAEKLIKEMCQKDINFKFRGYIVEGQVSTFGSNDGPEELTLVLVDQKDEKIQTTKTVEKGLFKFKPINPGTYTLKPLDDISLFDKNHNQFTFTVNLNDSNFLERALIIRGFTVSGKVLADNEPLSEISTYIYSFNSTLTQNYNCDYGIIENLNENVYNDLTPFCSVNTDSNGSFGFKNIPYGKFLVKPIYKDKYVSYNTVPQTETFDVEHKDFKIEQPFQVNNFSIYGFVVNSIKNGIPNVTIKIDGQIKAITDVNGTYKLENLTPGNYDLEAQESDMFFEPLTNIKITANMKKLPDLMVTDYKLCGKILIEATEYFSIAKRTVILQDANDKSSKKERRTITDNQGKYCFEVKPGTYHIKPVLTQDEKDSDLHLQPEFYDLEVVDRPLLDVNFYQSKVVISGKIHCIAECEKDIKVKLISGKTDRVVSTIFFLIFVINFLNTYNLLLKIFQLNANVNDKHEFVFNDILSGQYRLAIIKPEWCWDQEDIQIKVQNTDVKNIDFKQAG